MRDFDHSDLDGRLLQLLLAVVEEGSVTRAAQRLGVTQSAVSHLLDKLRAIVDDPLFVKSGRGIVATARAQELAVQARLLLDSMRRFVTVEQFDPARLDTTLCIAANDLQRDLLLPALFSRLRAQAPRLQLHVRPSDVPEARLLRDGHCQLVVSPRPPEASDVVQKRLFEDHYRVFFDARQRAAPLNLQDYLASEHASVVYEPRRMLDIDHWLAERGVLRRMVVTVPGFAGVAPFLRGSPLLATLPGLLGRGLLRDLQSCEVPLPCPAMPMYMVWHLRHQHDPVHRWLRRELEAVAAAVLSTPEIAIN